jgi:hypothetical protein
MSEAGDGPRAVGRPVAAGLALVLGACLLLGAVVAGALNRNVVDEDAFADHVEAVRTDPEVVQALARAITTRTLLVAPDLVAVRPLVETVAAAVAGSPSLRPLVDTAARQLHRALTRGEGATVLRLADVGALLAASLRTVAPEASATLPDDLDVTLARVGSGGFADATVRRVERVRTVAWAAPLGAVVLLAAGLALSPHRYAAARRTGTGIAAGGLLLATATFVGGILAGADTSSLRGALRAAAWARLAEVLWWRAAALVLVGVLVAVWARYAGRQPGAATSRTRDRLDLSAGWVRVLCGAVLAVAGVLLLVRPEPVLRLAAGLAGVLLLLAAAALLAGTRPQRPARLGASALRPRALHTAGGAAAVLLLAAVLVPGLRSGGSQPTSRAAPLDGRGGGTCNGHAELCDRPYDQVAQVATHNSMAAADEEGWFLAEQPTGLIGQLDAGVRVLLIDTWRGQHTASSSRVATAPGSRAAARAQAEQLYGSEVVASALRLRRALGPEGTGRTVPFLCHALCELGATEWEPVMHEMRRWLDAHPREVVTLFIQDEVGPAETAALLERTGFLPVLHVQQPGAPWPTLGAMVDSGRRVVVLMENRGGGQEWPFLLQGFEWVQDTPYDNPDAASFSCRRLRGPDDASLLLVNHWLAGFRSLVSDAEEVNARGILLPQLRRCQHERGQVPDFVAVNFYDRGDVFAVVDTLNGVG